MYLLDAFPVLIQIMCFDKMVSVTGSGKKTKTSHMHRGTHIYIGFIIVDKHPYFQPLVSTVLFS